MHYTLKSPEETQDLAAKLLKENPKAKWWLLKGNLGAGKTTFVKGIAKAWGKDPKGVKSPTYTYMQDHGDFVHIDLYRLEKPDIFLEEQLEEYIEQGKVLFVEWPERLSKIPAEPLILSFKVGASDEEREISLL